MNLLLLGAGYSAQFFARRVAGQAATIAGTTRSPDRARALRAAGIAPVLFDGTEISAELAGAMRVATHLAVSAAPLLPRGVESTRPTLPPSVLPDRGARAEAPARQRLTPDPLLRLLPSGLAAAMPALRWAGYLSTVGVYGNHDGAWVDEDSALRPGSARAAARVAAERDWLEAGAAAGIPVAVLRLSGIYGPGRNALANLAAGTARRTVKPGQVFNRIHVDDIAGALAFLGEKCLGGVFNVTDDEPGPPQDVVAFAAALMGVAPPPELPYDETGMTPMARSFWRDNKRVSNARLKAAGYRLRFPDHRAALTAMWTRGDWRISPPV